MQNRHHQRRGFSLVELVIVIVIIGVIAAIAVPRLSRGAKGARDSALRGDLAILRNAIDLYSVEHRGDFPAVATFVDQLTTYSDEDGATVAAKDVDHIFGPYLKAVPGLPVEGTATTGGAVGDTGVGAGDLLGIGWIYDDTSGTIIANTGSAADDSGTAYSAY